MLTAESHPKIALAAFLCLCLQVAAGEPPRFEPERFLPEDTLFFASAKSWDAAGTVLKKTPYGRAWSDIALKPFREAFKERLSDQIIRPVERELGLKFEDYRDLLQGSLTFAVIRDSGATAREPQAADWLLVIDTKTKAGEARKSLAALRKRWSGKGQNVRSELICGQEFLVLSVPTNNPIRELRNLLPKPLEFHELGRVEKPSLAGMPLDIYIGQANSLVLLSCSAKPLEKVLVRLAGGAAPTLAGEAAYQVCHNSLFREAPLYAWLNAKPLIQELAVPPERTSPEPPAPADVLDHARAVQGSGLSALAAAGLSVSDSSEGIKIDLLLNIPSSDRQGLFRLLAGDPNDVSVPAYVPADVVRLQRWRMDGSGAWTAFQKMMSGISPQWTSTIEFIIDTANQAARIDDPSFDLRKNLLGNFADDFIKYGKGPPAGSEDPESGPSLLLIKSPNPDQFAAALQRVLIFLSPEAETPAEREFLGRKIYTVPLPAVPLPFETAANVPPGRMLHYSATSAYVAISTDAAMLEEFLRSPESHSKALKDLPGLREAMATVTAPSTSLILFENQSELTRINYEAARSSKSATNKPSLLPVSIPGMAKPENSLQNCFDFSLLPPFERISRHFHVLVRGSSSNADGILVKWFMPAPPDQQK